MTYLLDTNAFIQPYKRFYHPAICPAYWEWLDRAYDQQQIVSIEEVRNEIRDPGLVDWIAARPSMFVSMDEESLRSLRLTMKQVEESGRYDDRATREYADAADCRLVAHAHARRHTVVTFEVREPRRRVRVKIPDVCDLVNVECIDPFEMLRRETVRFELAS